MNKPFSKVAIALWIVAAVVVVINLAQIYIALQTMTEAAPHGVAPFILRSLLAALTGTISPVAMLAGFGWLIELVDRMAWSATAQK